MRGCVLIALLLIHVLGFGSSLTAASPARSSGGGSRGGGGGAMSEEQMHQYSGMLKCKVCTDAISRLQRKMNTTGFGETIKRTHKKQNKEKTVKAMIAARAHELVDGLCDELQGKNRNTCVEVLGVVEDELIAYVKLNTKPDDLTFSDFSDHTDLCLEVCDMQRQIKEQLASMQEKLRSARGGDSMMSHVFVLLKENWIIISFTFAVTLITAVYLQWKLLQWIDNREKKLRSKTS